MLIKLGSLTHFSKSLSDLKQNGTQGSKSFPHLHVPSCSLILIVVSVSSKEHHLTGLKISTANQKLLLKIGYLSFVPFCLVTLGHLERCLTIIKVVYQFPIIQLPAQNRTQGDFLLLPLHILLHHCCDVVGPPH